MNGIHDTGGAHGYGPVYREPNEPVFRHDWEKRVMAMFPALYAGGNFNIDELRHAIERMSPIHYLEGTYYEHWMHAFETLLVEKGVLTSGVMYDLVTHRVPFVLAGSIRDDGPLRDTVMDLIEAQERYAALLEGAGLVVMLSSMLHAIGVGNMLPSWVKVVCVDINPAVVTKLSDRGSAQTVGVVTDVGLFLKQLATQLAAHA